MTLVAASGGAASGVLDHVATATGATTARPRIVRLITVPGRMAPDLTAPHMAVGLVITTGTMLGHRTMLGHPVTQVRHTRIATAIAGRLTIRNMGVRSTGRGPMHTVAGPTAIIVRDRRTRGRVIVRDWRAGRVVQAVRALVRRRWRWSVSTGWNASWMRSCMNWVS